MLFKFLTDSTLMTNSLKIPKALPSITKGVPLKELLNPTCIDFLAENISIPLPSFDKNRFKSLCLTGLDSLGIMDRGNHISLCLKECLPQNYTTATNILLQSLTPPLESTSSNGLEVFFYLPHVFFVKNFGLDYSYNGNIDPFETSMNFQYEITKRFSSEFSIRPFLINQQDRTLEKLLTYCVDLNPHVRRFASEGSRPRLPWSFKIPNFVANPYLTLPILEKLKNDDSLYVRRSVANHLGDIAKDHPQLVLDICSSWLPNSSKDLKWLIRHALRYLDKKNYLGARDLRLSAR